jgi:hypothetical protein
MNDKATILDVFRYDGNKLNFIKGCSYDESGFGNIIAGTAISTPSNLSETGFITGNDYGWSVVKAYMVDADNPSLAGDEEKEDIFEEFQNQLLEIGIEYTENRHFPAEWDSNISNVYVTFPYEATDGELEYKGGIYVMEDDDYTDIYLYRRDYTGMLDYLR